MKSSVKKLTAVFTALTAATALVACSSEPTMSAFQNPRPWQASEGEAAYESLGYSVAVYDTKKGATDDKRVLIADGTLGYVLSYSKQDARGGEATLDMKFNVVYNDKAPENDVGATDSITSKTLFRTDSLEALSMQKTVTLGARKNEDESKNKSYSIDADYSKGKATREMYGKTQTLKNLDEKCWDNELMFYLARATGIKKGSTTNFYMTNLFDCFEKKEYTQLTMVAAAKDKLAQLEFDPWIKDYVITKEQEEAEKEEADNGEAAQAKTVENDGEGADDAEASAYTLPCFCVEIAMSVDERGPSHFVYYSERPMEEGGLRHKKVPVKITYAVYQGGKVALQYEYTLTSLSFTRPQSE